MATRTLGVILNGVTGRMGTNQHLIRSILAIREQGGVTLPNGDHVVPDPVLVGRNAEKLRALARRHGVERWSDDLAATLADPANSVYFDAQATALRAEGVRAAIAAGKHIYCEKPLAQDYETALALARQAQRAGVKHGVVQDKLFLPGLRKLDRVMRSGFLGRILEVRGEFGYWVFEGDLQPAQRPAWNYRREDGGGIIVDMVCHWDYVITNLFGPIHALTCLGATHLPQRFDERGHPYPATADDAAYTTFQLESGAIAHFNSSWCTRPYRDELLTIQVDGELGSAVAGLHMCKSQSRVNTPRAVWNPDLPETHDYRADWLDIPANASFENGFKAQWELFLAHVAADTPFPWDLFAGARGVRLAELALRSWRERAWVDVPPAPEQ